MFARLRLVAAVAIFCVCFRVVLTSVDNCGTYSVKMDQNLYPKHRLTSSIVESTLINRPLECYSKCLKNCLCVSFNVCNGGKKCELNFERKDSNISMYESTDDCDYYEYGYQKQTASGICVDSCCSSSQPCLHGGKCQARSLENNRRFTCVCPDGFHGTQCQSKPRSCAAYAQSSNRTRGHRLIYAPDNSSYSVFCYFYSSTRTMTLAMSYSRGNSHIFRSYSLAKDYPGSEDSQNWNTYRLSLARMKGLRDVSTDWVISCAYPTRGLKTDDYIRSKIANTDPLTHDARSAPGCRLVEFVNIKGKYCENCTFYVGQGSNIIHTDADSIANHCNSLGLNVIRCSSGAAVTYFGKYHCYDLSFHCTKTDSSTTQFWFVLKTN